MMVATTAVCIGCNNSTSPNTGGGRVIWRVPSATGIVPFVPTANTDRSMVYFATTDFRLKKLRGRDGQVMWNADAGGVTTIFPHWNVVLSADVAAISKIHILAFDTTSGALRWTYRVNDEQTGYSPLVANDSTIFSAGRFGRVHAVNAKSGTARWVTDLREGSADDIATFNPTLAGNLLFVCTQNFSASPLRGALWALDVTSGAVRWTHRFAPEIAGRGSTCYGGAAVWNDLVIEPQSDGRVFAFDQNSGQVRWISPSVHNTSLSQETIRHAAVGGDIALVTNGSVPGMIVAYDAATGVERWRRTAHGGSIFPPAMDATTAYVDHEWFFTAYDIATGAVRWETPQSITQPSTVYKGIAIIAGDRIFVGGRDGSYALWR